jgi:S1-C subfamily serine protease/DNA-directed RNA polymerase specialized sigma24 family protein
LLALAPEVRCAELLTLGRTDLTAAQQAVSASCGRLGAPVSAHDIAWALSWNIDPAHSDGTARCRVSTYQRRWSADTPWTEIWAELTLPRRESRGAGETTLLRELACSVACEHRQDWRHPDAAPIDHDAANAVFDAVYARDRQKVGRDVQRRFGERPGDPDGIADEAWSRAFQTYWSSGARRRFAGLSRISTLVSQIASFIALDVFREQDSSHEDLPGEDGPSLAKIVGLLDDPVEHLISQELRRRILCCTHRLPARRQLLVHLVWLRQHKAVEAARMEQHMGTSTKTAGRTPWLRRPLLIAAAASVAVAAASLAYYLPGERETLAPSLSGELAAGPQPGQDRVLPAEVPVPTGPLTLDWTPDLQASASWIQPPPGSLPRQLPDFDRPVGGATLGARTSPYRQWQLATLIVRSGQGWGSGALISADGWLLTNYHVVEREVQAAAVAGRAATVDVIAPRVEEGRIRPSPAVKARVFRVDPVTDLALLKLETAPAEPVPFFRLARQVVDGDDCIVIGSQGNGPAWWVRTGTVSQQFEFPSDLSQFAAGAAADRPTLDRNRVTVLVTDTRGSGGDSGGPLLNEDGELIGLTFATPASAAAGSVGWHIALAHLRPFIANLPQTAEGVPFDAWTAGLGERVGFDSELLDSTRDGRVDAVRFRYAEPSQRGGPRVLAQTTFVRLGEGGAPGRAFADRVPFGLWGMDARGRFRFDVFITTRADGVVAVGYTNEAGQLDEIRVGRVREPGAGVVWRRNAAGRWHPTRPSPSTPLVDEQRLGAEGIARLQARMGPRLGAPAAPHRTGPSPGGTGPNVAPPEGPR